MKRVCYGRVYSTIDQKRELRLPHLLVESCLTCLLDCLNDGKKKHRSKEKKKRISQSKERSKRTERTSLNFEFNAILLYTLYLMLLGDELDEQIPLIKRNNNRKTSCMVIFLIFLALIDRLG